MRAFYAQVWIDDRPVLNETVKASNPATAVARAMRDAIKKKAVRHRPDVWTVKIKNLKAAAPAE